MTASSDTKETRATPIDDPATQAGTDRPGVQRKLRLAVVHASDPENPTSYSGLPTHLIGAFRQLGAEVVPVAGAPSARVGKALAGVTVSRWLLTGAGVTGRPYQRRELAELATEFSLAEARVARRRLGRSTVDAAVVVAASELGPIPGVPYVAYEDMTVRQAARYPAWLISRLPERDLALRARLQERQFQQARAICTNTWWARDSVVNDYGIDPERVHVVGFGGRHRRMPQDAARSRANAPRFLYAGRDWARKNGDVILGAFELLHSEHPEARLDIVGHHQPIDRPGVNSHGFLALGDPRQQRRLDELFASATCFLMPSEVEPSGLSLVEAGSCGLPSIVTTEGGAAEVVGEGGIAVRPGDAVALAEAMRRMCDLGLASRLGELARRHVLQFTWELTARRILSALGFGEPVGDLPRVCPPEHVVPRR